MIKRFSTSLVRIICAPQTLVQNQTTIQQKDKRGKPSRLQKDHSTILIKKLFTIIGHKQKGITTTIVIPLINLCSGGGPEPTTSGL